MWRAADDAGVVHACGFNYRFVPAVRRARELVEAGTLGELVHFRARYLQSWGWDAPTDVWRFDRAQAGTGAIGDLGAHIVDLARFLAGEIDDGVRDRADVRRRATRSTTRSPPRSSSRTARSARSRRRASRSAASTRTPSRSTARAGSIAFDLERFDELLVSDGGPYRVERVTGDWWPPGPRRSAGATRSRSSTRTSLRAIAGEGDGRAVRRDVRGRLPRRGGLRRDPALRREREKGEDRVPMKTSLGIWAFGPMVTRFVPGGYQPQWAGESTAERVRRAVDGLGDLIDGYEFHYPQELSAENLDEVRDALGDHDIYCLAGGLHLDPRFGKRRPRSPDDASCATRRSGARSRRVDFAGELGAHFIIWPGIEGYNYPFQTPYAASRGRGSSTASAQAAERRDGARRDALPRAQELRAGDEDPDAEHRDDAARDPHAAASAASTTSRSTWTGST